MRHIALLSASLLLASPALSKEETCGGFPVAAVATGTTGAVTATLTANPNSKLYVCSVHISYVGGTDVVTPFTITGTLGGTLTYYTNASQTVGGRIFYWDVTPCWPASAMNTNIVVATTANATATNVSVDVLGCMR